MKVKEDNNFEYPFGLLRQRVMDNDEARVTFLNSDDSGYAYTMSPAGGWQNAHYHKGLLETYIVQTGSIAFAYINPVDGEYKLATYSAGETVTTETNVSHNIFMFPGAILHTVKHGIAVANQAKADQADWYEAPAEFDAWTKALTADQITQQLTK